jgi:hypothetical protein
MEITLTYNIEIHRDDIKDLLRKKAEQFINILGTMNTEVLEITDTTIILYHDTIINLHLDVHIDNYHICIDYERIASISKIKYRRYISYIKEPDCE